MAISARTTYLSDMVATASPARLLLMLLDRLQLDVQRAIEAQESGRHEDAATELLHAQEIVAELRSSLRVDTWVGGPGLSAVYDYLFMLLVRANVRRDAAISQECLSLVEPLVDAWRQAAAVATAS